MAALDELLKVAQDTSVPVSVVLRKAFALASTAGDEPFKMWLNYELNGYGPSKDIPDYRRPKGMLLAYGRYGGITPVMFRAKEIELEELMCCPPIGLPITKIEAELDTHRGDRTIMTTANPVTMEAVREHWGVECAGIQYTVGDFQHLLEGARTRMVTSLAELRRALPEASIPDISRRPRRSAILNREWWRDQVFSKVVAQVILWVLAGIATILLALIAGPFKRQTQSPATQPVQSGGDSIPSPVGPPVGKTGEGAGGDQRSPSRSPNNPSGGATGEAGAQHLKPGPKSRAAPPLPLGSSASGVIADSAAQETLDKEKTPAEIVSACRSDPTGERSMFDRFFKGKKISAEGWSGLAKGAPFFYDSSDVWYLELVEEGTHSELMVHGVHQSAVKTIRKDTRVTVRGRLDRYGSHAVPPFVINEAVILAIDSKPIKR
ncbi:MAG TPA: hypothetical protein VGK89_11515 [Candidatus Eisenbacteria bacterium]|jgi:hypothetical protein